MEITLCKIKIREVAEGYDNKGSEGIVGLRGNLNIRPAYQREYVYFNKQRESVVRSVRRGLPLSLMYWAVNDDGRFEILDGQQRTISICEYLQDSFSVDGKRFSKLTEAEQQKILDYELTVYQCKGSNAEKLEWFKIVNIAGVKLTDQELRNAIYTGPWLDLAKAWFSKKDCPASEKAQKYLKGFAIRQNYLETALKWIADRDHISICDYMEHHQFDQTIDDIRHYFNRVIEWVDALFPVYREEMKGIHWGLLYNRYQNVAVSSEKLEKEIQKLYKDEEVTSKSGIYAYLLSGETTCLKLRKFTPEVKQALYAKQKGICSKCRKHVTYKEMTFDKIVSWEHGGKAISGNCRMVCKNCR